MTKNTTVIAVIAFVAVVVVLSGACATGGRQERDLLLSSFKTREYQKALHLLETSKFYQSEDATLLKWMERGSILHHKGDWRASLVAFEKAQKTADKLYTKSLSKKVLAAMANDTYDIFYGEVFERSMIYFYSALNHLLLYYQLGPPTPQGRKELMAARAKVLAWDSYLKSIRDNRLGQTVFKNDLLAKVLGGIIHETVDTVADRGIALQLYKDAKEILLKNYNAYPSFNRLSKQFKEDFDKLPTLSLAQVKKKYVAPTPFQEELSNFLDEKIAGLKKNQTHNVSVLFQRGIIPPKVPDLYYFGLGRALEESENSEVRKVMRVGAVILMSYAIHKLGLLPPLHAPLLANEAAIAFELPKIDSRPIREKTILEVFDLQGKKVASKPLPLANPLGEIAEEAVAEGAAWRYGRVGLRLALKHLAAIAASYATYKLLSKGQKENDFWAKSVASTQYAIASRAIRESEKADTRSWSTLPRDLRMTGLSLPSGRYRFQVVVTTMATPGGGDGGGSGGEAGRGPRPPNQTFDLGTLSVEDSKRKYFIAGRSP